MSSSNPPGMDQLFANIPSTIHAPPQTPLPFLNPNPSWNTILDQDEYDDDFQDLPPSSSKKDNRQIRRRSSKACDQCRKSKCKCERPGSSDEPCKNCVLLGTPCTFLGPSRKRGPPKGYIDAIESRLHQMEALLGTLLSSGDPRARSLVQDLTGDPLASDIFARVDDSPFGTRGKPGDVLENRASRVVRTSVGTSSPSALPFASPSPEWQEHLKERLRAGVGSVSGVSSSPPRLSLVTDTRESRASIASASNHERGESPRQRRRVDSSSPHTVNSHARPGRATPSLSPASATSSDEGDDEEIASAIGQLSLNEDSQIRYHSEVSGLHILGQSDRLDKRNEGGIWRFPNAGVWPRATPRHSQREWEAQECARLPNKEDQREMLDLYFSYVHPVLPLMQQKQFWRDYNGEPDSDWNSSPSPGQPLAYVSLNPEHAVPDVSSRRVFNPMPNVVTRPDAINTKLSNYPDPSNNANAVCADSADTSIPLQKSKPPTTVNSGVNHVPTLLLLAMFAVAARYRATPDSPLPWRDGDMWNAGDEYLEDAKRILNQTYASSRPSTCQALLLLSYREIGIGAMAQAWLYVGMAVRMAQDLGMHRSADRWQRTGSEVFSETERQVRKRIWYSCVIMDKYVSTYIGRPLSIFERDFDTPYPAEDPEEEMELWKRHNSACPGEATPEAELPTTYVPLAIHLISCFNASARLSGILSNIVESIYAVHPPTTHSRHTESSLLEKRLDKWYIELPDHLQLNGVSKTVPPPHVLTLHMQYWCSVLLLHRPFIRRKSQQSVGTQLPPESDAEATASCRKAFNLCAMASTQISTIVTKYKENFCLRRSPAFLTYYVFSAGIMHVTTLSVRPVDVQAALGLQQCMDALQTMHNTWPSAGRAWELLHGAKIDMREVELSREAQRRQDKRKRMPEEMNGHEVVPSEPEEASSGVANTIVPVSSLPSAELHNAQIELNELDMQPAARTAGQQLQQQQKQQQQQQRQQPQRQPQRQPERQHQSQLPQPHQYTPALEVSRPPATTFPDYDRWPMQEGYNYPVEMTGDVGLTQFVNSGNYDPSKDLWKDFPEQFADPSLITSSLYGLPVMSGPLQGQAPPFIGEFASMYNNVQSASGSNAQ